MKNKLFLIPIIFLLMILPVLADTSYDFLTSTQIYTTATNNTYIFMGNDNNTHLIYGNVNGTIKRIQLNNISNNNIITNFDSDCNTSVFFSNPNSNNGNIYRFPNNSSFCSSGGLGSVYFYYPNGTRSATPTYANNQFYGFTYSGTNMTYVYTGTSNILNKKTFPENNGYPALNCYSQLSTVFNNNFGINLTLQGGLNQSYTSNTIIQHNLSLFYFQVDNRWFYFEETNSNDCTTIAQTLQEATLNFPSDITTTNNRYTIINDELYILGKDVNSLYLYSSQEVDVTQGLVCNTDNSVCYNQTGVCFPNNEFYTGVNSSNYLCTNVSLIGTELYCDLAGLTYYAGGCLNTEKINLYGITYTTGMGYNDTSCSNDCDIEGLTYSDTSTSYKICGFSDADACLDWSNSIPCADGEYSLNGFCYSLNTTGNVYYSLKSFSATPNLEIATSYDINTNPKVAYYDFEEVYATIGIDYSALPTSFYINKVCDYKTVLVVNDLTQRNINTTYTYSLSGFTNGNINYKFNLPNNGTVNFKGLDGSDRQIYLYNISINETYGVCLYSNDSLLGCEAVDYLDISNIELTVKTARPQLSQLYSVKLIINKENGGYQDIYTGFFIPNTNPVTTLIKTVVESNNATMNTLTGVIETQISEPWKNTTWTIIQNGEVFYQHNCIYSSTGCFYARSYYKDDLGEGNWNTQDWNLCVNSLNGEAPINTGGSSLFNNLSKTQKLIYAFILSAIVFMFFAIFGLMQGEREGKAFIWVGFFLFIAGIIIFTILEWIPVWILIVAGIIASLGVVLFFSSKSQGV